MTPRFGTLRSLMAAALSRRSLPLLPLVGAAAAGAYAGTQAEAIKGYHEAPTLHIVSMHHATGELYCVDNTRTSPAVPIADIYSKVSDTLWREAPPSGQANWDDPDGSLRVFWMFTGSLQEMYKNDCEWLYQNDRETYDAVIVKFRADDDTSNAPCGDGDGVDEGISCTYRDGQITWEGHTDYKYGFEHIESDRFTISTDAQRRHTINHETGHTLGLADPGPCYDGDGNRIVSVMHSSFYCSGATNYEWPQVGDLWVVSSIMNQK